MDDRPFTGVFIPAKLYLDRNLNWNEKLILIEVQSLTTDKEPCFANNEHFANHLGISKKRASEIINQLIKRKYLYSKIKYLDGTKQIEKRWLLVNNTYDYFQGEGIYKNTDTPIPKNTEDNNINKNNITPLYPPMEEENFFYKFWKVYPRKVSKGNAEKWFKKNKPSKELVDEMINKIEQLKNTEQWKSNNGQYIPYPTSWLNAKGWEDEIQVEVKPTRPEKVFFN